MKILRFNNFLQFTLEFPILLLCFATAALAQTQNSSPTFPSLHDDSQSGTLLGRVIYDDTGLPVRHIAITLINPKSSGERYSVITDRRGEFVVKNLRPGDYIVDVDAPDLITFEALAMTTTRTFAAGGQVADFEKSERESQQLMVLFLSKISFTGRETSRVDIRVKRGGAISGKVNYADGSPAANMAVEIFSKQDQRYVPARLESIHGGFNLKPEKTDSLGHYRITGLLPGEYVLSVTEPSANKGGDLSSRGDVQSLLITFHPSVTDIQQAQMIQVQLERETTDVDVVLSERNLRTLGGTLKTQLSDKPVAGARVFLSGENAAKGLAMTGGFLQTQSDEEGRWAFYEVPDGQYVIQFSPEPGANEAWSYSDIARLQNFVELKRDITVKGDSALELAIKVVTGGRLSGTVAVEGNQKFPGIHLILKSNGKPLLNGQAFGVRPDFSFAVSGVVAEDLEIAVIPPTQGYYTKSVTLNGRPLQKPFKVADGDSIANIKIVLAPVQ